MATACLWLWLLLSVIVIVQPRFNVVDHLTRATMVRAGADILLRWISSIDMGFSSLSLERQSVHEGMVPAGARTWYHSRVDNRPRDLRIERTSAICAASGLCHAAGFTDSSYGLGKAELKRG